uniref:Uncharacterized protein n=1 Tax=Romanomermis culicivorax TaxID=13658 RepID=A0A915J651_ROMCU
MRNFWSAETKTTQVELTLWEKRSMKGGIQIPVWLTRKLGIFWLAKTKIDPDIGHHTFCKYTCGCTWLEYLAKLTGKGWNLRYPDYNRAIIAESSLLLAKLYDIANAPFSTSDFKFEALAPASTASLLNNSIYSLKFCSLCEISA